MPRKPADLPIPSTTSLLFLRARTFRDDIRIACGAGGTGFASVLLVSHYRLVTDGWAEVRCHM
jgi:hypothetical protein